MRRYEMCDQHEVRNMGQHERALDHQLYTADLNTGLPWRLKSSDSPSSDPDDPNIEYRIAVDTARRLQAQRQRRLSYFSNKSMFAEPSWDILLCLSISQAEAGVVCLGDLSISANCAPGTALRWLNVLAEEGLVSIVKHSEHLPEIGVALSAQGKAIMCRYLIDVSTD